MSEQRANPRHPPHPTAVALTWGGSGAPILSAKGEDSLAEQIIAIAKEYDIPLHEDAELAKLLVKLDIGEEIPPQLYIAVAKVIAFAYYLAGRRSILEEDEA
ncbi:MAG: flagellar biosynthesis protein [Halothiobacillaceae bacterium]|nr:MAG: flagellar biosynthesis protein [Halothiobacillaceae bacterium]